MQQAQLSRVKRGVPGVVGDEKGGVGKEGREHLKKKSSILPSLNTYGGRNMQQGDK